MSGRPRPLITRARVKRGPLFFSFSKCVSHASAGALVAAHPSSTATIRGPSAAAASRSVLASATPAEEAANAADAYAPA